LDDQPIQSHYKAYSCNKMGGGVKTCTSSNLNRLSKIFHGHADCAGKLRHLDKEPQWKFSKEMIEKQSEIKVEKSNDKKKRNTGNWQKFGTNICNNSNKK